MQLARIRGELADLDREAHDLATGDDDPGADIVPARSADPVVAKQQLAAIRSRAARQQTLIKAKRDELEAPMLAELAAEQAAAGGAVKTPRALVAFGNGTHANHGPPTPQALGRVDRPTLTAVQVGRRLSLLARHGFAADIDREYMAPTQSMITDAGEDALAERAAGAGDDGAAGERPRPAAG